MNDKHNFAGYIEHHRIQYFCTVNDYIVKMFCKDVPPPISGLRVNNGESIEEEYIFGFDENNVNFAVLMPQGIGYDEWLHPIHFQFDTPVLIKYNDQTGERHDLSYFDAIEFYGKTVNKIFNPRQAVNQSKGISRIEDINIRFKPHSDYCKEFDIEINNLNARIEALIYRYVHLAEQQNKDDSISLGSLNSAIRIKFDSQQSLETLSRHWLMFNNFLVFLSGRQNIDYGVRLLHKNLSDMSLSHFADVLFRRRNSDIYDGKIQDTIQIDVLGDKFPALLKLFADKNPPFLRFLPEDNQMTNRITDADVMNICTAFDIAYGNDITEDKDIIVRNYQDAKLHWKKGKLILAKKIWFLYQKATNTTCLNEIKKAKRNICAFVKLRNTITHTGKLEWGNSAKFSVTLIKVLYGNILLRTGMDKDSTIAIIERKFRM